MILPRPLLISAFCFLHGTMLASEGLLKAAIAKSPPGELRDYFAHHLEEETGHVLMLEADLARLGCTEIVRFPAAAQIAGAQYYYIQHDHPAMLLGYMSALEKNGLTESSVDALERAYGPLTCSRHHAVHDVAHSRELRAQIDALPEPLRSRVRANEAWTISEFRVRVSKMIYDAARIEKVA